MDIIQTHFHESPTLETPFLQVPSSLLTDWVFHVVFCQIFHQHNSTFIPCLAHPTYSPTKKMKDISHERTKQAENICMIFKKHLNRYTES
jgi:hypothetical protein